MNKPTIGRIVHYNTTEADRKYFQVDRGNESKQLPAIVVAVWSDTTVNLKVIGDARSDLWKTSVTLGTGEGTWEWPARVEVKPAE